MMHASTRDYTRKLLQSQLEMLTHSLGTLSGEDALAIAKTVEEIREVANYLADIMTHHMDAAPVEQPREVRSALHLFKNVLGSYDAIRDAEVTLGTSDLNETRAHVLMRDMRRFVETERQWANGEVEEAVEVVKTRRNGKPLALAQ